MLKSDNLGWKLWRGTTQTTPAKTTYPDCSSLRTIFAACSRRSNCLSFSSGQPAVSELTIVIKSFTTESKCIVANLVLSVLWNLKNWFHNQYIKGISKTCLCRTEDNHQYRRLEPTQNDPHKTYELGIFFQNNPKTYID